ncbi:endonuclease III [Desulfohalobiaceae bacterium Ax17]|uniref:endonuclease III n=1 Tax=Desulfovulcanus ferrireducens TaxID=2831190 RepID=UPI00207BB4B9|nr:endonuclease III [Desulfovulcanus ferrireducens]MBT8763836.1 endonuclease III [Desulfovulcanus ferrireducens]
MNKKERAIVILQRLRKRYPAPKTALNWANPWQLLVATVLAAQCTDQRVNQVTPEFFRKWPDVKALAQADLADVEAVIRSTGFYRNKAKNLVAAAQKICTEFNGQVPETMEELVTLPGVARKTANIVLSNAFGKNEGIAVDTHVKRLSFRLGLTTSKNPNIIEKDLMVLFPKKDWGLVNHVLVLFGREICTARQQKCGECELSDICPKLGLGG